MTPDRETVKKKNLSFFGFAARGEREMKRKETLTPRCATY